MREGESDGEREREREKGREIEGGRERVFALRKKLRRD